MEDLPLKISRTVYQQVQAVMAHEVANDVTNVGMVDSLGCLVNCVYSRILDQRCSADDHICLCKNIHAFLIGGPYQRCFLTCRRTEDQKEVTGIILDVCGLAGVQSELPHTDYLNEDLRKRGGEPKSITKIATATVLLPAVMPTSSAPGKEIPATPTVTITNYYPSGATPYTSTKGGTLFIGQVQTSLITITSTTIIPSDSSIYISYITDPAHPFVTEVVGIPGPDPASTTSSLTRKPGIVSISIPSQWTMKHTTTSTAASPTTSEVDISTTTASATTTVSVIPSDTSTSNGLSTGSIIGVAVAVPLVTIGFFLAALIWFIRRRRNKKALAHDAPPSYSTPEKSSAAAAALFSRPSAPANTNTEPHPPTELHAPAQNLEADGTPQFELDSTPILISTADTGPFAARTPVSPPTPSFTYVPYRRTEEGGEPVSPMANSPAVENKRQGGYAAWSNYEESK